MSEKKNVTTMAATGSDSFSSGSVLSDTDLETIHSEELVIFHSTQTAYSNKKDIIVIYSSGNAVEYSPRDWIGLFKSGWQTMYDFSAYQWVPLNPLHSFQPRKRRTIFPQADVEALFGRFQFLYVTCGGEVIGVSECFDVCDLEPTLETLLNKENIPSSLSLISLGSQSSSDDSISWEITEKSIDVSDEILSFSSPSSSKTDSSALVPKKDNWTLSDFVVGNRVGGMLEKLRFVHPHDLNSVLEEYEPMNKIFLSPEGRCFIEEIHSQNSGLAAELPRQAGTSSDLVVADKASSGFSSLVPSGPFVFTLYRDAFPSQQSSLQMYQPALLKSVMEEINSVVPAGESEGEEPAKCRPHQQLNVSASQPGFSSVWPIHWSSTGHRALLDKSRKEYDNEYIKRLLEYGRDFVFDFTKIEPAEHDEDPSQSAKEIAQTDTHCAHSSKPMKQATSRPERNTRKKRWVQPSKIKTSRSNQDAMLQEALTLLTRPSSPSSSSSTAPSQQEPGDEESSFSGSAQDGTDSSRKRRNHNATGISKAKRRRLTRRTSTPRPTFSPDVEDEGYCSLGEEDNIIYSYSPAESIELLSLALTEALKDNAELRMHLKQAESKMSAGTNDASSSTESAVCKEKQSQCDKPVMSGKASNTEKRKSQASNTETRKTCEAAANTRQTAKKDSPVQCSCSKKGKATNTDKGTERHVASNTTAIAKTDTPSQCVTTSAKSINTLPASPKTDTYSQCVTTSAKSVNTLPSPPTKETESSTANDREPQTRVRGRSSLETQSQILSLDFTAHRVPLSAPTEEDPDNGLSEWRKVSSKRMIRLQKLIMKKRQEFARLRENAENHEKRTHILETSLQSVRTALSVERIKRGNVEKELRDLRIKFWELLGSRRSQPWGNVKKSEFNFPLYEKLKRPKLSTVSEPDLAKDVKTNSAVSTSEEQITPSQPVILCSSLHEEDGSLPERKEDSYLPERKEDSNLPDSKEDSYLLGRKEDSYLLGRKEDSYLLGRKEDSNLSERKEDSCLPKCKEDSSLPGRKKVNILPDRKEKSKEPRAKGTDSKNSFICECVEKSKPKKTEQEDESKPNKNECKEDKACSKHSTHSPYKRKPTEIIPVVATAQVSGVPLQVGEVKKSMCGSISFKKFLMPAMAALAETFSSSKYKTKTPSTDEPVPGTTPATGVTLSNSSSPGAFAKVTVSFSTDAPRKSSSKQQKPGCKSRSAKRSRSRGKEKGKLENAAKAPSQETNPESSSDITLHRRHATSCPKRHMPELTEVLPAPIMFPIPGVDGSKTEDATGIPNTLPQDQCEKETGASTMAKNVEKWRPLNIPAKAYIVDEVDAAAADDDDDDDVFGDVVPPVVQPTNVCLAKHGPAGKGRPFTYTDAATGKPFTRNHLAKAVISRRDVMRDASSSELPDIIPMPACNAFSGSGEKSPPRLKLAARPTLSSPLSCFFRPPPSSSLMTTTSPTPTTPTLTTPLPATPSTINTTTSTPLPAPFGSTIFPLPSPPSSAITTQPQKLFSQSLPAVKPEQVLQPRYQHHHHHHYHPHQQQPQLTLSAPLPSRAGLHFDLLATAAVTTACHRSGDATGVGAVSRPLQFRPGPAPDRCQTCGMKFAPSVDRYLVEEHLYFHHAFTE